MRIKVKIITGSSWYQLKLGQEFEVYKLKNEDTYFVVADDYNNEPRVMWRQIEETDCEVLSPTPQVQSGLSADEVLNKYGGVFGVSHSDAKRAMEEYAASKVAEKEREIERLKQMLDDRPQIIKGRKTTGEGEL